MRFLRALVALGFVGALALRASADFSTPFLEGPESKVGVVSEEHGYVLADESDDGPLFHVMVESDTDEHFTILARAEKGIVPPELIGRWVVIRAEVVKAPAKSGHGQGAELKILSVTDARQKR